MGMTFTKAPRTPIGLDVGGRSVKAVQLERLKASTATDARWRVAAAALLPRESLAGGTAAPPALSAAEAARLVDVLERQGFTGRDVVASVPADRLLTSTLELPPRSSGVPLEQLARLELARSHKCAPDALEMDCWDLPTPARAGKASHVMAVGCSHAEANALLDPLEAAGLNVCALDAQTLALARACGPALAPPPALTAVLDLGWRSAVLALLHGGVVVYCRVFGDAGVGRLQATLSDRLRIDADVADYLLGEVGLAKRLAGGPGHAPDGAAADGGADAGEGEDLRMPADARGTIIAHADAVLRELRVSFSYAAHQYANAAVSRCLVAGGGAGIPGLADYAAGVLGIDVRVVSPADALECPTTLTAACRAPALTAAAGLAQFAEL